MKIILCGPPLAGKSYYGQKLAKALHWPFLDIDLLVERRYFLKTGEPLACRQIAQKQGLAFFYLMEQEVIEELGGKEENQIIAVGGGAMENEKNVERLKQIGKIIYIQTDVPLLLERLRRKETVPAYLDPQQPEESYLKLIEKRSAAYEKCADYTVRVSSENENQVVETLSELILNV